MKPGDFFLSAMDFFAILMPGAILTFLLIPWSSTVFGFVLPALTSDAAGWVAFGVSSYVLGHLLHAAGSMLDTMYDRGYAADKRKYKSEAVLVASKELIRKELSSDIQVDSDDFSFFQWAGSYVRANNSTAAAELERAGGDSKFFRSLCIVAALAATISLVTLQFASTGIWLALMGFSYFRFCRQRWQASQRTYEYFLLLKRQAPEVINSSKRELRTTLARRRPIGGVMR